MCTFNGMGIGTVKPWKDNFTEEYNDDGELVLVSKAAGRHEEEGLAFGYRFVITAHDIRGRGKDNGVICICMYMALDPKDWCEKALREAAALYGWEKEDRASILEKMRPEDAVKAGNAVLFGKDSVEYSLDECEDGFYDVLENREAAEKIDAAASAAGFYENASGFFLDKYQNRIGSTGWDTLNEVLHGKDRIRAALERVERKREHENK